MEKITVSRGDVEELRVESRPGVPSVDVSVYDHDSEARALIVARLWPSEAIRLARALLAAAGVDGVRAGNVQTFTFID